MAVEGVFGAGRVIITFPCHREGRGGSSRGGDSRRGGIERSGERSWRLGEGGERVDQVGVKTLALSLGRPREAVRMPDPWAPKIGLAGRPSWVSTDVYYTTFFL